MTQKKKNGIARKSKNWHREKKNDMIKKKRSGRREKNLTGEKIWDEGNEKK